MVLLVIFIYGSAAILSSPCLESWGINHPVYRILIERTLDLFLIIGRYHPFFSWNQPGYHSFSPLLQGPHIAFSLRKRAPWRRQMFVSVGFSVGRPRLPDIMKKLCRAYKAKEA
jgi:hypothetical protein